MDKRKKSVDTLGYNPFEDPQFADTVQDLLTIYKPSELEEEPYLPTYVKELLARWGRWHSRGRAPALCFEAACVGGHSYLERIGQTPSELTSRADLALARLLAGIVIDEVEPMARSQGGAVRQKAVAIVADEFLARTATPKVAKSAKKRIKNRQTYDPMLGENVRQNKPLQSSGDFSESIRKNSRRNQRTNISNPSPVSKSGSDMRLKQNNLERLFAGIPIRGKNTEPSDQISDGTNGQNYNIPIRNQSQTSRSRKHSFDSGGNKFDSPPVFKARNDSLPDVNTREEYLNFRSGRLASIDKGSESSSLLGYPPSIKRGKGPSYKDVDDDDPTRFAQSPQTRFAISRQEFASDILTSPHRQEMKLSQERIRETSSGPKTPPPSRPPYQFPERSKTSTSTHPKIGGRKSSRGSDGLNVLLQNVIDKCEDYIEKLDYDNNNK